MGRIAVRRGPLRLLSPGWQRGAWNALPTWLVGRLPTTLLSRRPRPLALPLFRAALSHIALSPDSLNTFGSFMPPTYITLSRIKGRVF